MSDRHSIKPFPLRLEANVKGWVQQKAENEDRSQNWTINQLIKEAMQREQKQAS